MVFAPSVFSGRLCSSWSTRNSFRLVYEILLSNDDGVYSPGLAALEQQLRHLGDVFVAAPATEQSGVGHSITYLTPLLCKSIHRDGRHWAWLSRVHRPTALSWPLSSFVLETRLGGQRH